MPGLPEGLILTTLLYLKRPGCEEIPYTIAPSFLFQLKVLAKGWRPPGSLVQVWAAGLTGIWHARGEATVLEGGTGTCQDAGGAGMLVGSLLLALYPHEPASHEYLRKPEKVTTACLLSIWHFCMSLLPLFVHVILLAFLSFSPWHSARSPFFLA